MNANPTISHAPRLERVGHAWRFIVDGKPFLIRGGEVHNSSGSSRSYMAPIWPKLKQSHLNTVLVPVTWESFEPREGEFDDNVIDWMVEDARANGLKLVVLWFASWKNGESHYAPLWVKRDRKRFPFGRSRTGTMEILSALGEESRNADAKAFERLCKRIAEIDHDHTVIAVQIENEVGFYGDSRDRSPAADAAFAGPVPQILLDHLAARKNDLRPELAARLARNGSRNAGTWTEVFGADEGADEIFMAWNNARYIEYVAAAGKRQLDVPMFVNAAVGNIGRARPGQYFSGGPLAHLHDIWRAAGDALSMYAPDLYMPEFVEFFTLYNYAGNPAFMPEMKAELEGAANVVYAIGRGGLGGSPFGIESRTADFENGPLSKAYALIEEMEPIIVEHQAAGSIISATVNPDHLTEELVLGDYRFIVQLLQDRRTTAFRAERGYVIIMQEEPDTFLVAGYGVQVRVTTAFPNGQMVGFGGVQEGRFVDGEWKADRWLNGDELRLFRHLEQQPIAGEMRHGLRLLGGTADVRGAAPMAQNTDIQRVTLFRFDR